jgi:hypothetical protein
MVLNVDTAPEFLDSLNLVVASATDMDIAGEYLRGSGEKFILTFRTD